MLGFASYISSEQENPFVFHLGGQVYSNLEKRKKLFGINLSYVAKALWDENIFSSMFL